MVGTFFYLTFCGLRNRIRVRFRRLREPRYLIGTVVGLLYLYFFIFRRGLSRPSVPSSRPGTPPAELIGRLSEALVAFGSLFMLIVAALSWVLPASRRALEFSRSEVQFLFQAPVSRRDLLHYKLLRSQLGLLISSVVLGVVFRPSTLGSGWRLMVGTWLLLMVNRLYLLGVSFTRESLVRHGIRGLARLGPPIVALGAIAVVGVTIALDWPRLAAMSDAREVAAECIAITSKGAAGVVLWPFQAMIQLPLSASTAEFFARLPVVLLMLGVFYWWVIASDAQFEEAAAQQAEKQASGPARTAAPKAARVPFALALDGRPETAVLWKNLIMVSRYLSLRTLLPLSAAVVAIGLAISGRGQGLSAAIAMVCLMTLGITLIMGPQIARNDLRQDLGNLAVLKTWPVAGPALLRGELLAPLAILTTICWLLIAFGAVLFGSLSNAGSLAVNVLANRLSYAIAAILVVPGILVIQLVIQNGVAILFPAWAAIGASRARGVEAMGQRIVMLFGLLLSLALSLVPAALAAALVMLAVYLGTGLITVIVPALAALTVMVVEGIFATEWLGRVLDRTDISAVEPTE